MAKQVDVLKKADPALHSLLEYCKIEHLPTKRLVVRPGDPADKLYYIIEGSATITMEDNDDTVVFIVISLSGSGH